LRPYSLARLRAEAGVADGVVGEGEMVGREDEDHFDIVEWLEDEGRGET
jgi:hypothetical protein